MAPEGREGGLKSMGGRQNTKHQRGEEREGGASRKKEQERGRKRGGVRGLAPRGNSLRVGGRGERS